ncbi:hypothetical protein JB92DRAFT_3133121 [Gautieria morchelliformis]|nr:hypothetical protein JB92DRAFT_3133121 [Gautieria morchelliformis]
MPPLKKRSRQAKQQRVSGGKCFDAGLADELLDVEMDPTYSPEGGPEEADNVEFDADFPWAFSLLEPTEEAGTDEEGPVELVQIGSKRNVDIFEEEDSEDETGGMDLEAECAEAAARKSCEFWKKVFASAAAGSAKITSFFGPKQLHRANAPSPSPEPEYISSRISMSLEELPVSLPAPVTDQSNVGDIPQQRPAQILEEGAQETSEMASIWVDPTADDEDEPEMQDTYKTVQKLISEAKRYKSFTSLVHLYVVKSFLELQEKYRNSSRIKNPVMCASYTVAVSIGKGPYVNGEMPLRKKGQDRAIHISDFIVEHTGRIVLLEEEVKENLALPPGQQLQHTDAREIIYPGKNHDGWWNMDRLISQGKRMLPIFERMFPGAIGEFFFDQSSAHGAFAPDALNAKEMNVKPGGKQRKMHATFIPNDNPTPELHSQPQQMVFPENLTVDDPNYEFQGQSKGMHIVLEERGLMPMLTAANGGKPPVAAAAGEDEPDSTTNDVVQPGTSTTCFMSKCLSTQQDFMDEKLLLQIVIEEAGHKCYFLPKL